MSGEAGVQDHKAADQPHRRIAAFLLEDQLALLRRLAAFAWLLLLLMLGASLGLRLYAPELWPQRFGTGQTFDWLLALFAINTLALSGLLLFRDWYERIPRHAEHRVGALLAAVLLWLGLYSSYLFHVTGGLSGPWLLLLPVAVTAALALLPPRPGTLLAAYLLAAHGLVLLGQHQGLLAPEGALAAAFALVPAQTPLGWLTLALGLLLAAGMGLFGQRLRQPGPQHPALRLDAGSGLFREAFLRQRLQREMRRGRRQQRSFSLVHLHRPGAGPAAEPDAAAVRLARLLLDGVRLPSDSPARLDSGDFAVLLPATDATQAEAFCARIRRVLGSEGQSAVSLGVAVVPPGDVSPESVLRAAAAAAAEATDGAPILRQL